MKAIKTQNTMKQVMFFLSMLLFLFVFAQNANSQEISGKPQTSAGDIKETEVKPGAPSTNLFKTINSQLAADVSANTADIYEEGMLFSYSFPKEMFVEFKVYDKTGNELKTLTSQTQNAGSFSIDLGSANLKKGTYFYKLTIGSDITVKKVVLQN